MLYVNKELKIGQKSENIYEIYVNGHVEFVDYAVLSVVALIQNGIEKKQLICILKRKMHNVDTEQIVNRLLKADILIEEEKKYNWKPLTFGISCMNKEEINAVNEVIFSQRLCRNENMTIDSFARLPYSPCCKLERTIAKKVGKKYCLVLNSGTSALECAFWAIGLKEGDEVICSTFHYIGAAMSMISRGARPVLCDIDESIMLDVKKIEEAITPKTKCIMLTHLQGKAANISEVKNIARRNNLYLLEDCAQAFGVEYRGKHVGSFGDVACFSFHQHKLITSGEGGAFVTNNKEFYERAKLYSDVSLQCINKDNIHIAECHNLRMGEITASILFAQMAKIENMKPILQKMYCALEEAVKNVPVVKVSHIWDKEGMIPYSIYYILDDTNEAKKFAQYLNGLGITAHILLEKNKKSASAYYYWTYILEMNNIDINQDYLQSMMILSRTVSISLGIDISMETVFSVCSDIKRYFEKSGSYLRQEH